MERTFYGLVASAAVLKSFALWRALSLHSKFGDLSIVRLELFLRVIFLVPITVTFVVVISSLKTKTLYSFSGRSPVSLRGVASCDTSLRCLLLDGAFSSLMVLLRTVFSCGWYLSRSRQDVSPSLLGSIAPRLCLEVFLWSLVVLV